jgi:hypothetical protein
MAEDKNINPYANPDGSPIEGKEPEFFDWAKQFDKKRLEELPENVKKEEIESQESLQKRMES